MREKSVTGNVYSSLWVGCVFLLGILYRFLIGLQGVDYLDAGFSSVFYQNILTHPDVITYNYLYYLPGIIGGYWLRLFPEYGLQGLRLLESLCLGGAIFFLYLIFRKLINRKFLLFAIIISFLFPTIVTTFHYNTVTYFFVTVSAYYYSRAVFTSKRKFIFVSGILIGIVFFGRIVNLSLLVLLVIPFFTFLYKRNIQLFWRSELVFVAGMILGVFLMLSIMMIHGHIGYIEQAFQQAFGVVGRKDDSHSLLNLIFVYWKSLLNQVLQMLVMALLFILYARSSGMNKTVHICVGLLTTSVLFVLALTSSVQLTLISACSLLLLAGCIFFRQLKEKEILLFLIMSAYVLPLGSDIGVAGIFHWMVGLLVFPAAFLLQQIMERELHWGKQKCIYSFVQILCFSLIFSTLIKTGKKAYGEKESRLRDVCLIQSAPLNVFVDAERAEFNQDVICQIDKYTQGQLLMIGNQAAEIYFATQKIPFLGRTCIGAYTGILLDERMEERTAYFRTFPSIVFLKETDLTQEEEGVQSVLTAYMNRHCYELIYEDENMKLFTSSKKYRK